MPLPCSAIRILKPAVRLCLLYLLLLSPGVYGKSSVPKVSTKAWLAGLNFGSLGPGISLHYRHSDLLGVRTGIFGFGFEGRHQLSLVRPNEKLPVNYRVIAAPVLADFYFWRTPIRISLGFAFNGSKLKYDLTPQEEMTVGDLVLNKEEVGGIRLDQKWSKLNPYLGLGYTFMPSGKRIGFGIDCGAFMLGKSKTALLTSGIYEPYNTPENKEAYSQVVNQFSLYPFVNAQLIFRISKE